MASFRTSILRIEFPFPRGAFAVLANRFLVLHWSNFHENSAAHTYTFRENKQLGVDVDNVRILRMRRLRMDGNGGHCRGGGEG
jgi:hypothetical protein